MFFSSHLVSGRQLQWKMDFMECKSEYNTIKLNFFLSLFCEYINLTCYVHFFLDDRVYHLHWNKYQIVLTSWLNNSVIPYPQHCKGVEAQEMVENTPNAISMILLSNQPKSNLTCSTGAKRLCLSTKQRAANNISRPTLSLPDSSCWGFSILV